ncbi:hypothetical protein TrVE_jg1553 [Triparma verrucosa]|uniref:C2H2-type domain-containing protein n=1 Tax=Triparma verrucosa TaxID=1606542 RepID=A0A9W7FMF9_9STRA|nr:hypothetical protein TrVE_jg1553 [Triparma verrucosa]
MVKVDRRSKKTAEEEDASSSSGSSGSSYEWVTDSEASDEEVTDAMVEASLAKTLLSMVPFTAAYREANEAMFELNDIKGMQAEVARCKELKELLDQGLHDEGLAEMMADTTMDFHQFNATKYQMRQEGLWNYETMRQKTKRLEKEAKEQGLTTGATSGVESHVRKKLMIRRIFDEQRKYELKNMVIDFGQEINWHGSTNVGDNEDEGGGAKRDKKHQGCKWRGENDEGVDHMCNNAKLQHPWRTYKDEFGAEVPEQISFCHYHAKFCLDPNKNHGDHLVKIKEPNEYALCNECFVQKVKRPPPHLPKFRIPGVNKAGRNVQGLSKLGGKKTENADALNEDTVCDWKPNRAIIAERGLSCLNKVFRNPDTRALCKQCGWHLEECAMVHKDADASKKRIAIPNEFGLCVAHYVSKFGKPPPKHNLPFPGMEKRVKEEEKIMTIEEELSHPLRPPGAPEMEDPSAIYIPPIPPKGVQQKMKKYLLLRKQNVKIEASGNSMATRIQKNYRMYWCQCEADRIRRQRLALKRHYAAVSIQKIARRYIQKEEVEEIKKNTVAAVNLVIRLCRGMLARKAVKRKKAAKVLQRGGLRAVANALMYAVKSTLEVRHEHEHEEWGHLTLQRYAKGFVTRLRVRQRKAQVLRETWASVILQKKYRGRIGRRRFDHLSRMHAWKTANATVLQATIRRSLAVAFVKRRRREWNAAALVMQRFALVFIARCRVYYERQSIQLFWDWLAPTLPKKAFDTLLPKTFYGTRTFTIKSGSLAGMSMTERSDHFKTLEEEASLKEDLERLALHPEESKDESVPGESFFRKYDPDACGQVSRIDFSSALQDMWDNAGCPLLVSEQTALTNRFDHHNDGWIDYHRFLRFAERHQKPCAVHGRLICADCISYGQCVKHGFVICSKFHPQIASPNVCTCGAYITAHEMVPEPNLDEEYAHGVITKDQMDNIFKKEKRPDLEKPARIGKGKTLNEVLNLTRYDIEKDMRLANVGKSNVPVAMAMAQNGGITMQQILNAPPPNPPPPPKKHFQPSSSFPEVPMLPTHKHKESNRSLLLRTGKMSDIHDEYEEKEQDMHPARIRAKTEEMIKAFEPHDKLLVDRQEHHVEKDVHALPNRDQHFHSIKHQQYENLNHMVKSQHAPHYTESVKMIHHENHLVSYANETFKKREQSLTELEKGFKITNPIPLISDGELRLTTKAVDLYLHIFNKVRDEKLKLIEDDIAFVNFCFNFIVFLERHWRKLCKDIRTGKLNKHLPISKAKRTEMESSMLPNPKRAKLLEESLRKLGFHDRASGTKATSKTVNEDEDRQKKKFKKHVIAKIKENEQPMSAREHRLPMNMGIPPDENSYVSGPITDKERKKMRKSELASKTLGVVAAERHMLDVANEEKTVQIVDDADSLGGADSLHSFTSNLSSSTTKSKTFNFSKTGSRFSKVSDKSDNESLSSQFNITDQMRKMTLRDYFTLSLDYDETADAMNTKFPSKLIRRASESDLRPMSMQNLFRTGHIIRKLPRPVPDEIIHQPQRTVKGFICGFPGCGQVFMSATSVAAHQKQHQLRSRLGVSTPMTDQYLQSVFPSDIPWKVSKNKIVGNAAPYVCPVAGCSKTYPNPESVKKHILMGHSKSDVQKFITTHLKKQNLQVEFFGNFRLVPPFAPPDGVPTLLCPHHAPLNPKCPICLDVISARGPVPPIKFYQSVKSIISNDDKQKTAVTFDVNEFERGPLIIPRHGGRKLKYAQLKAVCCDTLGHNFAAVCCFYSYAELKNMGFSGWTEFGEDAIDRDNELFMETEVSWVRLESLKGSCYTLCCERDEYKKRRLMGELPKEAGGGKREAKFCRYTFNRIDLTVGPKRVYKGKGGTDGKGNKYSKMMAEAGLW